MFIEKINESFENIIKDSSIDIDSLESNGISVRCGNKVLKLSVTETEELPIDEIKKELEQSYQEKLIELETSLKEYKDQLKLSLQLEADKLRETKRKYENSLKQTNKLPNITIDHANKGLYVVNDKNGGLIWFFKCVYAPKYVNEKRIDPSFAKRLMTPILLKATVNEENKVISLVVNKIIGDEKFKHYHDTGYTDCWGDTFRPSSFTIKDPDEAIAFFEKALYILETINEFSLGNRSPKGLSRFNTIKKHLTNEVNPDVKKSAVTSRNRRSGFDTNVNEGLAENNAWIVD